jgi:hypothetical protein
MCMKKKKEEKKKKKVEDDVSINWAQWAASDRSADTRLEITELLYRHTKRYTCGARPDE